MKPQTTAINPNKFHQVKYLHIFQIALSGIFTGQISTDLLAQSPIQITLECDSASATIFYQDFINAKVVFPDSLEVFYSRGSSMEVSVREKEWIVVKDPVQNSHCDEWWPYIHNGQRASDLINLPALFFQKPAWFESLKKAGGEISLRYSLVCSIDSATTFQTIYSDIKKMIVPAATKDDIRAMNYLMNLDKDDLQYFCWLHEDFDESRIKRYKFVAKHYPNSVLADIAKYYTLPYDIRLNYEEDGNYQKFQPKAAKIYKELTNSKSAYLRLLAGNRL